MNKMNIKLVCDLGPTENNARNSEGSFLRSPDGSILFAYSRYNTNDFQDAGKCDIALIRSYDEGESWSEPQIIARGIEDFGVNNIMSVSGITQLDGSLAFYFIIKENDGTTTIGRTVSKDGISFKSERCSCNYSKAYYVFNNDRLVRLSDGRLMFPASRCHGRSDLEYESRYEMCCVFSEDDGKTFDSISSIVSLDETNCKSGLQEAGAIELQNGVIWLWARTDIGRQYQSFSTNGGKNFSKAEASIFSSPCSPLEMLRTEDGTIYSVYNPIPLYNGRKTDLCVDMGGRTPIIIRKSLNDGAEWGECNIIEDDENRGYCYPSMFITKENSMLCSYCRGGTDDICGLNRLGIAKFSLDEIK